VSRCGRRRDPGSSGPPMRFHLHHGRSDHSGLFSHHGFRLPSISCATSKGVALCNFGENLDRTAPRSPFSTRSC